MFLRGKNASKEEQPFFEGGHEVPDCAHDHEFGLGGIQPENPDMEKAMTEMKRDSLLERYQFFVGAHT